MTVEEPRVPGKKGLIQWVPSSCATSKKTRLDILNERITDWEEAHPYAASCVIPGVMLVLLAGLVVYCVVARRGGW